MRIAVVGEITEHEACCFSWNGTTTIQSSSCI